MLTLQCSTSERSTTNKPEFMHAFNCVHQTTTEPAGTSRNQQQQQQQQTVIASMSVLPVPLVVVVEGA